MVCIVGYLEKVISFFMFHLSVLGSLSQKTVLGTADPPYKRSLMTALAGDQTTDTSDQVINVNMNTRILHLNAYHVS